MCRGRVITQLRHNLDGHQMATMSASSKITQTSLSSAACYSVVLVLYFISILISILSCNVSFSFDLVLVFHLVLVFSISFSPATFSFRPKYHH